MSLLHYYIEQCNKCERFEQKVSNCAEYLIERDLFPLKFISVTIYAAFLALTLLPAFFHSLHVFGIVLLADYLVYIQIQLVVSLALRADRALPIRTLHLDGPLKNLLIIAMQDPRVVVRYGVDPTALKALMHWLPTADKDPELTRPYEPPKELKLGQDLIGAEISLLVRRRYLFGLLDEGCRKEE